MTAEALRIRTAFLEAAAQLGVVIGVPPIDGSEALSAHLTCHVVHFGNLKGCIPVALTAPSSVVATVQRAGYYCSQLSESYEQFDVHRFRDTLNDWGYFGPPAQRPAWYAGYVRSAQA